MTTRKERAERIVWMATLRPGDVVGIDLGSRGVLRGRIENVCATFIAVSAVVRAEGIAPFRAAWRFTTGEGKAAHGYLRARIIPASPDLSPGEPEPMRCLEWENPPELVPEWECPAERERRIEDYMRRHGP